MHFFKGFYNLDSYLSFSSTYNHKDHVTLISYQNVLLNKLSGHSEQKKILKMNKRNHISANIDFKIDLINKKRKGALDNCTKALFWLCGLETSEHLCPPS